MKNFKEKTWDNLSEGDILIDKDGNERAIIQILGRLLFISVIRSFNDYEFTRTAEQLVRLGYKIKGASEDKPSIGQVIEILFCTEGHMIKDQAQLVRAIEMLKKIKGE